MLYGRYDVKLLTVVGKIICFIYSYKRIQADNKVKKEGDEIICCAEMIMVRMCIFTHVVEFIDSESSVIK